ncbi:iron regulated 2 [Arabidopsis thaliana]|jgi:iron-regulated transporter 1|uniref:Solute carrier family 40 member 2 n=1 Tax=Arabidopsis thaliana TaxID=3702 RepID=S40A2_ARATH|nr:iron regulated 2 [Arabidopsis thaliana]NP_195977.2 iron regulated 2 [Arabidopsis thaliana]F4KGN5.1 RecName: Full=Solute carrier family 40 member 2; AltName: Full=Ferroportin-2; AltName: Full=Iron-regulated transporter 2; Short=AtIREG2 [Arabidopsis thaliana]AED90628.1 iron regulated 2 [Arabidopsis thaliana]AED90629.1 iron regulated 2 [Arabidopsis thaliana]|eukprot:NP_001190217.1 iron regulated 2 [Arabidopsis thaliana]
MEEETETRVFLSNEQHQEEEEEEEEEPSLPRSMVISLYLGYFLARWGARTWEFSVALYMIYLWPNSLFLTAMYGVVESGSATLFGPIVGQMIDGMSYVKVLRLWLVTQNLSFIVAGGAVVALLVVPDLKSQNFPVFATLVVLTNLSGAIGVLSTLAGTVLIERDWVVVMSEGHSPAVLTRMNSVIRGIDLSSKLLSPVITGLIISFVSLRASAITFAAWATITVWIEYWLFISVYNGVPAIVQSDERRSLRSSQSQAEETDSASSFYVPLLHEEESYRNTQSRSRILRILERISESSFVSAWRNYLNQEIVLPGVSLALLFFTVLSFGTLMTATLEWKGIPTYIIGIGRGISAGVGLAATVLYPLMQSRISPLRTGVWSFWSQWTCLLVCVGSIWVEKEKIASYMLMAGVAASRLGLWMFDLAVIQQMQDLVPESDRCVVGGVQNSLQSALDLMANLLGIIVSNPKDFWMLTLISFATVSLAGILYTIHLYRIRKHLFHLEKIPLLNNFFAS